MNNFGARSADYSSFQFSEFSFQKYEKSERIVGRGTPCRPWSLPVSKCEKKERPVRAALPRRPVCPPRCLKREARECTRRAKGKQRSFSQTALFFVMRYFHLSIAARLTRAARECRPYNFPPNFRNLKTENRKLKTRIIGALLAPKLFIIHYSLFIKRHGVPPVPVVLFFVIKTESGTADYSIAKKIFKISKLQIWCGKIW